MPELPEIETVKLQLGKVLTGRTLEHMEVLTEKTVQGNWKMVNQKKIVGVRRIAKVLIVDLQDDVSVAFHFKMTGQLILEQDDDNTTIKDRIAGGHPTADFTGALPSKHTRAVFKLDQGTMYFNDQRKFGWIKIGSTTEINAMKFLEGLGPEPMDIEEEEFARRIVKSKRPIKLAIMDQTLVSGVGNIYANDGLWEAKINPKRLANTLTAKQLNDLYTGVVKVLGEGIKYGGATAADGKYINLEGLGGHYQDHFKTYDREGEPCLRQDGGVIEKFTLGGRGTYWCPVCQQG